MLPTLALIQREKTVDYVVGFDDLGGTDGFSTEILAARLEAQVREGYVAVTKEDAMQVQSLQVCAISGVRHRQATLLHFSSVEANLHCMLQGMIFPDSSENTAPRGVARRQQPAVRKGGQRSQSDEDSDFDS